MIRVNRMAGRIREPLRAQIIVSAAGFRPGSPATSFRRRFSPLDLAVTRLRDNPEAVDCANHHFRHQRAPRLENSQG
jgi:hypothetical protein